MGRLLKLEFKRVLKLRITMVSIIFAVAIAILFVIWSAAFVSSSSQINKQAHELRTTGISAIQERKNVEKDVVLTEENMLKIYDDYKELFEKYTGNIPKEVFDEKVRAYQEIIKMFYELDRNSGNQREYSNFIPTDSARENIANFYKVLHENLEKKAKNIFGEDSKAYKLISENIDKIHTPLEYKSYAGWDAAMSRLGIIGVIAFFCCLLAAPMFSANYQNGADSIYRTTKYGRKTFAIVKIVVTTCVSALIYLITMSVYTVANMALFGYEGLKVPIQILSLTSAAPLTIGEHYFLMILFGLIGVCSISAITMFLSSRIKNSMYTIVISMILLLIPAIAPMIPGLPKQISFIVNLLPSNVTVIESGISEGFNFFALSNDIAIWIPFLTIIGSIFCFIVFNILTIFGHARRQSKR